MHVNAFCDMLINFSNNMLWSHLLYITLFSKNIYMLVKYLLHVTQLVNNIYIVFVVLNICCSKNPTSWLYVVYSTPGPMSSLDTVSNLTVFNGIIKFLWLSIMIMFQLRHHRETECHNQPSVMATWQIGVAGGPHVTKAHSARQTCVRQLYTE